jgi:2-amino-4-hydroxy-6-hydroxymethyldihydropteridine diphosphokinase
MREAKPSPFFIMKHTVYVGIGSNLGDKALRCEEAVSEILKVDGHQLLARSSLYRTRPVGYTDQDWFVNGVIKIESDLPPSALLRALKAIESRMGRRKTFPGGPRTIDLDILFYDDREIHRRALEIPHPRLHERQFVLVPLAEIDSGLIHPVLRKTVRELLDGVETDQGVEKMSPPR